MSDARPAVEQVQAAMADEADEFDLVQALAPTWLGFLDHASQGEGLWIETLQRWFGYCLTSDISLQKMLWLQGYPGTGKGTIREAITTVVGEDNTAMMTIDALAGRFDVASMVGKNAIFIPELRVSHQTNQAAALDLLNSISGGDPQKVDDKFKKIESFVRMTGKFVITPNEESSLTDPSGDAAAAGCAAAGGRAAGLEPVALSAHIDAYADAQSAESTGTGGGQGRLAQAGQLAAVGRGGSRLW